MDRALREATRTGDVVRRGRFFWPKGIERAQPRLAGPRNVDQIVPEELQDTILLVLRAQGPLTQPELLRAAARALGFQRTGTSLQSGIAGAIAALLTTGRASMRDGSIVAGDA